MWSSGMIPASGAGGPGFDPRQSPCFACHIYKLQGIGIYITYQTHVGSNDTVSEWLRRWTRNPLGSAREGSNPFGVASCCHSFRQSSTTDRLAAAPRTMTVWPSGLRRQTQVLVEKSAWVRTPQLSLSSSDADEFFIGLAWKYLGLPQTEGSLAERSKALASGASPKGREFESRSCHFATP